MKQLITMAGVVYAACLLADAEPVIVYNETVGGVSPEQQLVNAVTSAVAGATIRIKPGTYTLKDGGYSDVVSGVTNFLHVKVSNLTIEGETATSRTNWTDHAEPVIIDANGKGRIFYINSSLSGITVRNIALTGANTRSASGTSAEVSVNQRGGAAFINSANDFGRVVFTNCVFRQIADSTYGAGYCVTLRDCLVTNCSYSTSIWAYAFSGTAYGCDFISNNRGAIYGSSAYNCRFIGNYLSDGGAVAASAGTISNCYMEANSGWGGSDQGQLFVDCTFKSNTFDNGVLNATKNIVGCIFEDNSGGAVRSEKSVATWIENCKFRRNYVGQYSMGGAICMKRTTSFSPSITVTNCVFEGNRGGWSGQGAGGAIYNNDSALPEGETAWDYLKVYDSEFVTNLANSIAGVYGVHAVRSKFRGNTRTGTSSNSIGGDAKKSYLEDCEITGDGVELSNCVANRCTIHSVTNTDRSIFCEYVRATNCIVRNCGSGTGNIPELYGCVYTLDAEFVNCTFVTNMMNTYDLIATITTTNSVKFVNCLFNGNRSADRDSDFIAVERGAKALWSEFVFTNTYYGKFAGKSGLLTSSEFATKTNAPNSLMLCENPKFAGRNASVRRRYPAEPYWALAHNSPLLGKGSALEWPEGATDLAGRLRVKDGKVDIGCYQCWLMPPGFMIDFK